MRQETRFKFNAYLTRVAELNGIDAGDVSKNSPLNRRSPRP